MSETVLLMQISSEWGSFYAVLNPRKGDAQRWEEVGRLMGTVRRSFPEMHEICGWDSSVTYYEGSPWAPEPEDEAAAARYHGLIIEADKNLDGGDWAEVPLDIIDTSGESEARTECEQIHISDQSVHWSFYPKHSDTKLSTSSVAIKDILELVNRR